MFINIFKVTLLFCQNFGSEIDLKHAVAMPSHQPCCLTFIYRHIKFYCSKVKGFFFFFFFSSQSSNDLNRFFKKKKELSDVIFEKWLAHTRFYDSAVEIGR